MRSTRFHCSRRLPRALTRAVLTCATSAALLLGLVGSSQAATTQNLGTLGGLKYVRADSTLPETVGTRTGDYINAYCGSDWTATGGGAALAGDPSVSFVSGSDVGKYGVYGGGWHALQPDRKLSVYGICSKSPAVSTDKRYADFPFPPSTIGFTTGCAAGHVLGGGVETPYLDAHVGLTVPADGPDADKTPDDGWRGSGALLDVANSPILLIHYACTTGPQPTYRASTTQVPHSDQRTLKVTCQAPQHVSGGGASVSGPADEFHLAASRPFDGVDADQVPDDGWLATVSNDGTAPQTARVSAVCVG
ncbi:MAG: hypothetical protein ACJ75I_11165 [Solirubrobacterales bacterium]